MGVLASQTECEDINLRFCPVMTGIRLGDGVVCEPMTGVWEPGMRERERERERDRERQRERYRETERERGDKLTVLSSDDWDKVGRRTDDWGLVTRNKDH